MFTSGTTACPHCGTAYDFHRDGAEHHDECAVLRFTCQRLGYPLDLERGMEARKWDGNALRHDQSLSIPKRARGWAMVFDGHFERSLRHAVQSGLPQHHPLLVDYIAMRLKHEDADDPAVDHLIGIYGVQDGIDADSSYFQTGRFR